jgi:PAS domain-containing protein
MSTISIGSERGHGSLLAMRVRLATAFGALAGTLCVVVAFSVGEAARELARIETGRYLSRLAIEYHDRIDEGLARRRAAPLPASRGVMAAGLDLAWARGLREAIEASTAAALPAELMLVGPNGTVLIGPADIEGSKVAFPSPQAQTEAILQRWPDGERYLVAASPARTAGDQSLLGWTTLARTPAEAPFAAATRLQSSILWAGLFLALAGMAAGWTLATRHVRPLEALTAAAQQIASGNDRIDLPHLDDNREIARLAEALRVMLSRLRAQAESLRDAQDRLQRRVHERTAELVKVQAQLQLEVADAKLARDDLARAHGQLAMALEASGLTVWDFDVASQRLFLSAGWSQMLGGPVVETHLACPSLIEHVPEAARERVSTEIAAVLAGKRAEFRLEHPVLRSDGSIIWIVAHGRIMERDASGGARRITGTYRRI